ncbi:Gamma-glutamylputrescine oxidoreductase [Baekduia alba]|uniref:NAD(P)/FAD-dependent oxidoreductase n=1 Tax=Baekduia alba TaxID=2997333 RepID=UPI00233FAE57|nr:FAD-binding oxidoreductase [Baekduia alba]WCB92829.1 Gamma-glutamylputrescine oxidoreductase [Baekduia alba]
MQRSAQGYWLADAGPVVARPVLAERVSADVVVIGGGYLGMWTAWHLRAAGATVALLEADECGHGPSGRNGGFLNGMWERVGELEELFGREAALAVARAAAESIDLIDAWCAAQGVDAHLVRAPMLEVSAAPGQDGVWGDAVAAARAMGRGDELVEVDAAGARAVCDSPLFRGGVLWQGAATVHPARLALGLRGALIAAGVEVYEHSRVVGVEDGADGVVVRVDGGGAVRAGAGVLAINHASAGVKPLRGALSVASSHVVATEPVPDQLEALGWTGGEGIGDCRTMLHYFRTTRDGRVVFGWGGGRMGFGARRRAALDVDPGVQDATARDLYDMLPLLRGARIEHAWGGPIDVSPVHLPWFGTLKSLSYGFGFTGNGVGPTELGGRILADLARGASSELTALPIVGGLPPRSFPPEPARFAGGSLIRAALVRRDDAEGRGERVDPVTGFVAGLPRRLGLHLPR